MKKRQLKQGLFILGITTLFVPFQNCAPVSKMDSSVIESPSQNPSESDPTDDQNRDDSSTTTTTTSSTSTSSTIPPQGINFFNWNAETKRTSVGSFRDFFGATSLDCNIAHSGSCSMRLQVRGDDGNNQGLGADAGGFNYSFPIVGAPAIYYRWWMRIDPNFEWGNGTAKTKSSRVSGVISANEEDNQQGYTGYIRAYGFLLGECDSVGCELNNGGSNGGDSDLVIPYNFREANDGVWHEYIVKVKSNTYGNCIATTNAQTANRCDGQFEAWVDGHSVGRYDHFKLRDQAHSNAIMRESWGGWMVTPYFQMGGGASDGGTIHLDDFSTDNYFNSLASP